MRKYTDFDYENFQMNCMCRNVATLGPGSKRLSVAGPEPRNHYYVST